MDVYAQLSSQSSLARPEAAACIALEYRNPPAECPRYLASLREALREEYPPFATELYEEMYGQASASGQWLAMSFMTNAQREGDKARRLWRLAARTSKNPAEQQLFKQHACDESDHASAYLKLLDLVFPGAVDAGFRSQLTELGPGFSMNQKLPETDDERQPSLDEHIKLNLDEIRKAIHHVLQQKALPLHCSPENLPAASTTLNTLLSDELKHIAYTAAIIERDTSAVSAAELQTVFCRSFREFNRANSEEPIEYTYNQRFGNYP